MITLVTGSDKKLRSWQRVVGDAIPLSSVDLNQVEIQPEDPMDTLAIVTDKARRAYEVIQAPVVVEDVSAGLHKLGNFPGPYIKAAEQSIGPTALYVLAGEVESSAYVSCTTAYFDGTRLLTAVGLQQGKVVAPRTEAGWGFDVVFVPEGYDRTLAQLTHEELDNVTYRAAAVRDLVRQILALGPSND